MAYIPNSGSIAAWLQSDNASVITVSQSSVAVTIVSGSIAASFTPPANQSVSGTVGASIIGLAPVSVSNFPTTQNVSGSVVSFPQGTIISSLVSTVPSSVIVGASIFGLPPVNVTNTNLNVSGSVAAWLQSTNASVITVGTAAANQSVSGTVGASIIGTVPVTGFPTNQNVSGSVVAFQGTTPWTISSVYGNVSGSIAGTYISSAVAATVTGVAMMFKPNVSSSIMTEISPTWPLPITGAVAASISGNVTINSPSVYGNISGSVVAFQGSGWSGSVAATITNTPAITTGNASVITVAQSSVAVAIVSGSIAATFTPPANQSVSGTVNDLLLSSNASVITVAQSSVAVAIVSGSIAATFTPPANQSVSGTVNDLLLSSNASVITTTQGSVAVAIISGSVATATTNSSVMLLNGGNVIGSVATLQGTTPWIISSVYGNISGSIAGTYSNSNVASTVTGVAMMFKQNISTSIMTEVSPTFPLPITVTGTVPAQSVSGTVGASIVGQLPAGTAMIGSVVAYQGVIPWNISSVYGNVSGSVVAFQGGTQTTSIVGGASVFQTGTWKASVASNYATGAASIVSAIGDLVLGARNDTLASIFATANAQYSPFTTGSWGDQIISFAPSSVWTSGIASCFTGVEQPVIVSVLGRRVNVTGVQLANASANNVYMTFYGAGIGSVTGSIIGYSVVPANGGSNINYPVPLQTANNSGFSASVSGVASVFISAQGFYSAV